MSKPEPEAELEQVRVELSSICWEDPGQDNHKRYGDLLAREALLEISLRSGATILS